MIRDTSVVWSHSELTDAPVLTGTAGSLIALLDAVLITGWCIRSFDSVTVADGVATLVMSAGCPYEKHAVVEIRGHSETTLNRRWRVDTVSADRLTFAVDDEVPAGTYGAGSATVRFAPAGWAKPFADTNRAVYQSAALDSTQLYLYLDDTDPRYTRVRGHEHVIDIDTREGPFPTLDQQAFTNMTWAKSSTANSAARRWTVIADGSFMWVMPAFHASYPVIRAPHNFGDIDPINPTDAHHCLITAHPGASPTVPGWGHVGALLAYSGGRYFPRSISGTGDPVASGYYMVGASHISWARRSSDAPAAGTSDIIVGPQVLIQSGNTPTSILRGVLPGPRMLYQHSVFSDMEIVERPDGVFMCVTVVHGHSFSTTAVAALFDIVGPWR